MSDAQPSPGSSVYVLPASIIDSPAWQDLTATARAVFLELIIISNKVGGAHVPLTIEQAAKILRVGKDTASRAFQALRSAGYIYRSQPGVWVILPEPEPPLMRLVDELPSATILQFRRNG